MYNSMTREYHWPRMTIDVFTTVRGCCQWGLNKPSEKRRRPPELFPVCNPLVLIDMDSLGPLPKRLSGQQFVVFMADHYTESTRSVQMLKTNASNIASLLLNKWIVPYGVPKCVLRDNGTHFISKIFELLCVFLGTKHLAITPCTRKRTGNLRDITGPSSQDCSTTWRNTWKTGAYMCCGRNTHIMSRCIDRRNCRVLVLCYHATPCTFKFVLSDSLTDWHNNDNISALLKVALLHCFATMCQEADKGRKSSQRQYEHDHYQKHTQWAIVDYRRAAHLPWLAINDYVCGWASDNCLIQQVDAP